jgi:iron-sulfur cluster insertion protein
MLSGVIRRFAALNMTAAAASQLRELLKADFKDSVMRIRLVSGGCAGFRYDFRFEAKPRDGDHLIEKDGARVVLDAQALRLLRGATLDFVADPYGSSFRIDLPDSADAQTCLCGRSFGTRCPSGGC